MSNTKFLILEKYEGQDYRIILFDQDEFNHKFLVDVFESDDQDVLWEAFYSRYPEVNSVMIQDGSIEEADCLTLREAAEACMRT